MMSIKEIKALLDKGKGNKTLCAVLLVVGIWEMSNVFWALMLIN